ncbi:Tkl protein kinase [Globisporangium polare]
MDDAQHARKKPKRRHARVATGGPTPPPAAAAESEGIVAYVAEKLKLVLCACGSDERKATKMLEVFRNILYPATHVAEGYSAVKSAVAMDDVRIVRYLIAKGVRLDGAPYTAMSPLAIACALRRLEIAQLLHAGGACINGVSSDNSLLPLPVAVRHGHVEIVQWLVDNGAIVDIPDGNRMTPLMTAVIDDRLRIVRVLLAAGADPLYESISRETARTLCAVHGSFAVLKYLVEHNIGRFARDGACVNILEAAVDVQCVEMVRYILENREFERDHATASLRDAIRERNEDIAELLILHGADFTTLTPTNPESASFLAIEANMVETVELMIRRGLESGERVSVGGDKVMHTMAEFGDARMLAMVKRMFGDSVDLNIRTDHEDLTPFLLACASGNMDAVDFLLTEYPRGSFSINYFNSLGDTALRIAVIAGHVGIVARLLEEGALVEIEGVASSVLFHAASLGSFEAVQILCEHGAIVNPSTNEVSVLQSAVWGGHTSLVEYLIEEWDADVSHRAEDGLTVLDMAVSNPEVVRVLLSCGGAQLESDLQESSSALCYAALLGSFETCMLLVDHAANVNARFANTYVGEWSIELTPLTAAALIGDLSIVVLLCENGADVELATDQNETALHLAAARGFRDIVSYLLTEHCADMERVTAAGFTATDIAVCNEVAGVQTGVPTAVLPLLRDHGARPQRRPLFKLDVATRFAEPASLNHWARQRMLAAFVDGLFGQL